MHATDEASEFDIEHRVHRAGIDRTRLRTLRRSEISTYHNALEEEDRQQDAIINTISTGACEIERASDDLSRRTKNRTASLEQTTATVKATTTNTGRGYAVVQSDVRALAQRSSEAASRCTRRRPAPATIATARKLETGDWMEF